MTDDERAQLEQAIADAHLGAYQSMVIRMIARDENLTAAKNWIATLKSEVGDGAATTD